MTDEPEHVIPVQSLPHGSPPFAFHPFSFAGEFKLVNIEFSAATGRCIQVICTYQNLTTMWLTFAYDYLVHMQIYKVGNKYLKLQNPNFQNVS